MLLFKALLITNLFLSYSIRNCIIEDMPFDYEARSGITIEKAESKYDIKLEGLVLYEREVGLHGWGHEAELSYNKYDFLINKIFGKQIIYYRKLTSFERQVQDINFQTLDTGYSIFKILRVGFSVAAEYYKEINLMYYLELNIQDYLVAEFRIRKDKNINKIKLQFEYPLSKGLYLKPLFQYVNVDDKNIYWAKLEFGYRFKTEGANNE